MKFILGGMVAAMFGLMFTTAAIVTINATERQAQEWRAWR